MPAGCPACRPMRRTRWLWLAALARAVRRATGSARRAPGGSRSRTREDEIAAPALGIGLFWPRLDGLDGQHRRRRPGRSAPRPGDRQHEPEPVHARRRPCWCWRCSSSVACAPSPARSSARCSSPPATRCSASSAIRSARDRALPRPVPRRRAAGRDAAAARRAARRRRRRRLAAPARRADRSTAAPIAPHPDGRPSSSWPRASTVRFGGFVALDGAGVRVAAGRGRRPDRPERRRQDDVVQRHHRARRSRSRRRCASATATSATSRRTASPGPASPGRSRTCACSRPDRARERRRSPRSRARRYRRDEPTVDVDASDRRGRPGRRRRPPGAHARLRQPAAARAGPRRRAGAGVPAARRADVGHERRRERGDGRPGPRTTAAARSAPACS